MILIMVMMIFAGVELLDFCYINALVPFQKKKERLCVDYIALNKITVRNKYPLPHIQDFIDKLAGASIFTKLDLRFGYWQVCSAEADELKTAYVTRYSELEFLVTPFS